MAVRQLCFSTSLDGRFVNTYSWSAVADQNMDGKFITCAYFPRSRGSLASLSQDSLFLGTSGVDKIIRTFIKTQGTDAGSNVTGEAIFNRLDPSLISFGISDEKRFLKLIYPFINPFDEGATVYFVKDQLQPHIDSVTWTQITTASSGNRRADIPSGLARWIHIRILDESTQVEEPVLGGFIIRYYSLNQREKS